MSFETDADETALSDFRLHLKLFSHVVHRIDLV